MFARTVSIHLRPNSVAEFTQTIETEILPLLRKQKGFEDELTSSSRAEGRPSRRVCGIGKRTPMSIAAMGIQAC
jgi:hypothetical protein